MKKWSWKIGRLAGIDTEVHATFLLLLGWVVYGALADGGSLGAAILAVAFLFGVFASIALHELGHALTARIYGVHTRRILLLPIGGMAQLEGMPRNPRVELRIALAGPLVSFLLAALLALGTMLVGSVHGSGVLASFLGSLMWANLVLAVFNLLPAFPMDGGRALRAWLATRTSHLRATEVAVGIGRAAAVALGVTGLLWNPWLLLIATFVWFAAGTELRASRLHARWERRQAAEVEILPRGFVSRDPFGFTVVHPRGDDAFAGEDDDLGGRRIRRIPFGLGFWSRVPRR